MMCPNCLSRTRVIGTKSGFKTERYRKCPSCEYSFSTIEYIKTTVGENTDFFLLKNQDTLKGVLNKPIDG